MFFVLDGTLTVLVGEEEHELGPGDFAHVAPGTVHTFSNRSDSEVRMLNLSTPGGMDAYLRELAEATAGGEFDPAVVAEIAGRYDIKLPE
jgi:mannose-6-phosphate isomerase-like protein (cupin superfamily)